VQLTPEPPPAPVENKSLEEVAASLAARLGGRPAVLKKPAAASTENLKPKRAKVAEPIASKSLPVPSTDSLQPPIQVEGTTIYHDLKRGAWRVRLLSNPKHDKAFRYGSDPASVWATVLAFSRRQKAEFQRA
jgi:hypothetical protein